jgi:hypothetical protein
MRRLALLLVALVSHAAAAEPLQPHEGGLRVQTPQGWTEPPELQGAEITRSDGTVLRIDSVLPGADATGARLWMMGVSVLASDGSTRPLCSAAPDGTRHAMVVPGTAQPDGTVRDDPDDFLVACSAGAQGKCLRFGYRPWASNSGGGSLRPAYNACIHMVRADYGGDGQPHTRDGTLIDMSDDLNIQSADHLPNQRFEAGWAEHGAVCVRHVRIAGLATLEGLERAYPKLVGHTGEICDEAYAREHGAVVFNRSYESSER